MTLIEQIKQDQLAARKAAKLDAPFNGTQRANVLTVLIGEAEMIGKNDGNRQSTDQEVIGIIKKFIKNLDETIKLAVTPQIYINEKNILQEYLPTQMDEDALKRAISEIISTQDTPVMGKVLGVLKVRFPGLYDGALASRITKELLTK